MKLSRFCLIFESNKQSPRICLCGNQFKEGEKKVKAFLEILACFIDVDFSFFYIEKATNRASNNPIYLTKTQVAFTFGLMYALLFPPFKFIWIEEKSGVYLPIVLLISAIRRCWLPSSNVNVSVGIG